MKHKWFSKAWLYLFPALLILGVFQIYPIVQSFLMGFYTNFDYLEDIVYEWGTDNFVKLFHDADFRLAIKNTCVLTFWNVETGHDDVLSLRELSATPALWRAARRRRLGMKGTGLDERIEPEAGKEVSDADKSLPDRNGQ